MLKFSIESNGGEILDHLEKKDITLNEVGSVLLRLEQFKQHLISLEFDALLEYKTEEENGN